MYFSEISYNRTLTGPTAANMTLNLTHSVNRQALKAQAGLAANTAEMLTTQYKPSAVRTLEGSIRRLKKEIRKKGNGSTQHDKIPDGSRGTTVFLLDSIGQVGLGRFGFSISVRSGSVFILKYLVLVFTARAMLALQALY